MKTIDELKEWARREVELAKTSATKDLRDPEAIKSVQNEYVAAYHVYCKFLDESEGLDSVDILKQACKALLHEENLSPIVDSEEDWLLVEGFDPAVGNDNPGWSIYQCKRRSSLFKKVTYDRKTGEVDEIAFRDIDRAVCIDINKSDCIYTGGMGPLVLDEMMPITLPYSPCGKIRIFTEDFKYHEKCDEDLDTVGVLYFRMPDGTMKEVKRYFKEDHESKQMVEISQSEYLSRKKRVEDRIKKDQKKASLEE